MIKITGLGLMDMALKALRVKKSHVRLLSTCPNQALHKARQYGSSVVKEVEDFLNGVAGQFVEAHDEVEFATLSDVDGIDVGERLLYSATVEGDYYIATDDKRSLRALATNALCAPTYARLSGRIVCVAQTLLAIREMFPFENMDELIRGRCKVVDQGIANAWYDGEGGERLKEKKILLLKDQVKWLRGQTGHLLTTSWQ